MKVLLACKGNEDPARLAAYLVGRFDGSQIDIDVLSVIPGIEPQFVEEPVRLIAERGREYRQACAHLAALAQELAVVRPRSVRTHVEYGDPADVILAASRRWRSELLLAGAPRRRGLLTAFRIEGVTRRLLRWADCPLELLRADSRPAADEIVLLPLPLDAALRPPLPRLAGLPWRRGSRIHLLGILPAALGQEHAELSPAAVLLSLQHARDARTRASSLLADLRDQLAVQLLPGLEFTLELAEGEPRHIIVQRSRALQPGLLVLGHYCFGLNDASPFRSLPPAALTLSVDCPVLLLQDGNGSTLTNRKPDTARILKLAR